MSRNTERIAALEDDLRAARRERDELWKDREQIREWLWKLLELPKPDRESPTAVWRVHR